MKFIILLGVLLMGNTSSFTAPNSHHVAFSRTSSLAMSTPTDQLQEDDKSVLSDYIEVDSPNLDDLLVSQLLGCMYMYSFAAIREYVRDHRGKDWHKPELILTQSARRDKSIECYRYLRYPVTAKAQYEFIDHPTNWELLQDCKDLNTDPSSYFNVRDTLDRLQQRVDVKIVEFDDQFDESSLVYGITVNRTNKRITVLFRGSVLGGKDWATNVNAFYKTLERTEALKDAKLTEEIKVHSGFQSYLFAETERWQQTDIDDKFDQIVGNIKRLYSQDEYKGYRFCIAGHSLGGALTQLLAFHLAAKQPLKGYIPDRPITAISFASPQVGNNGYREAYAALERQGLVHHLRISNEGDVVPVGPFGFGYTQTGLHMHLTANNDSPMSVGYPNLKSVLSQASLEAAENHSLERYYERLLCPANANMLDTDTIQTLYDVHTKND